MKKLKLWAVAPSVMRNQPGGTYYLPSTPALHRVFVRDVGGIGEPNAGEFLVSTPCGYEGWVRDLNKNPDDRPACASCLNGFPSHWAHWPIPEEAVAKLNEVPEFFGLEYEES